MLRKIVFLKTRNKIKNEVANKVALITNESHNIDIWILDSESSYDESKDFKELEKVKSVINVAKSRETMQAFGKGCIKFDNCNLKKVLYDPKLTTNLLSEFNNEKRRKSYFHR